MPDLHDVREHQGLHGVGLIGQVVRADAPPPDAGAVEDPGDHLLRALHGLLPTLLGGLQEGLYLSRMPTDFLLGGEEAVPVEINAVVAGAHDAGPDAELRQLVRLHGEVGGHAVHLPIHEILEVPGVGDDADRGGIDPLLEQHGPELRRALIIQRHHGLPGEVRGPGQVVLLPREHDVGRVLEDGGQHHDGLALRAGQQQVRVADAELGAAR